jgi:putative chitinase
MRAQEFSEPITERRRTWGIGDITLHFEDPDPQDPPGRDYHRYLRQIERGVSDQERDAILKQLPMVRRRMLEFTRGEKFWLYDPKLNKAVGLRVMDRQSKQYFVGTVFARLPAIADNVLHVPGTDLGSLEEGWRDTAAGLALGSLALGAGAHTVKQGDTVYSIARANNTTPEVIARANGLDRNFTITPGQKLRIPGERNVLDAQRRDELARLGYTDRAVPARSAPADKPKPTPAAGTQTKPASSDASQPRITEPEKSRAADPPARAKDLPLPNAGPDERRMLKTAMRAGITRVAELAALLAQAAHESQDFTSMRENLYYSAPNLMKTFPTAFSSARIASQYANRPKAIANRAYANRLGNGNEASGDGWRYRGRGYIQLTGRDNYRQAGRALGLDLERNPDLASRPDVAAEIAAWYWKQRVRPLVRDFYDVASVTRGINPALRGLRDREQKFMDYYQIMRDREMRT